MGYWVFIVIYSLINVCILIWAARKYKKRIRDYYSYSDNIDISWLGKTIVILFACMIIWLSTNTYTDSSIGDIILYLSTIVFWSYITYHVCLMSKITENAQTTIEETHANAKQLEEDAREEYGIEPAACELLMKVMVEGKLYLNPKLTISEVANAIGTNRTYLSN